MVYCKYNALLANSNSVFLNFPPFLLCAFPQKGVFMLGCAALRKPRPYGII